MTDSKQAEAELESLLLERGKLSRLVGQAKKNGESAESYISQVKALSLEIDKCKAALKETASGASSDKPQKESYLDRIPPLFDHAFCKPGLCVSGSDKSQQERDEQSSEIATYLASTSDASDWEEYVQSRADSAVYHRWSFKEVIEKTFGHRCHYFLAKDLQGSVVGVLPAVELSSALFGHFIVSMPYFTYGGALADSIKVENVLNQALVERAKEVGASHLEIRKTRQASDQNQSPKLLEKSHKVSMVRALPDTREQFWSEVGAKVRAQVKKSERFDLRTLFGGKELVGDFYAVFARNMRDLGTPVYSKSFFENLFTESLKKEFRIAVTFHSDRPVAASFLMGHKGTREIPWASSLRSAASMNANMAMYAAVLNNSIDEGYQFFDFGRSSPDAGTYRFKKQWGAKPMPLHWYYWLKDSDELPELNPNNPKYKLLIAVWQRLPVWLTKLIGPPVIKFLP